MSLLSCPSLQGLRQIASRQFWVEREREHNGCVSRLLRLAGYGNEGEAGPFPLFSKTEQCPQVTTSAILQGRCRLRSSKESGCL